MSGFYQSATWRALRRAALERDGHRCTTAGCSSLARLTVDHVLPRTRGGRDELANLRVLCGGCHSRITRRGNAEQPRAIGFDADGRPLDPTSPWARRR